MSEAHHTSAIVLAGGLSRRLGQDKRRLRLWGVEQPTLLEHTVKLLAQVCADVVVVLNDPDEWPQLAGRCVTDVYSDGGALGGIYSGLRATQHEYAFTIACDMPLLNLDLIRAMLAQPHDYDVLVPRAITANYARNALNVEPLHAIYAKACLNAIHTTLARGQRQIVAFFPQVRVAYIEPADLLRHDPYGYALLNINTPEHLAVAQQAIAAQQQTQAFTP